MATKRKFKHVFEKIQEISNDTRIQHPRMQYVAISQVVVAKDHSIHLHGSLLVVQGVKIVFDILRKDMHDELGV